MLVKYVNGNTIIKSRDPAQDPAWCRFGRAQNFPIRDRGLKSQSIQINDLANWYLLLPSLVLGSNRLGQGLVSSGSGIMQLSGILAQGVRGLIFQWGSTIDLPRVHCHMSVPTLICP